MNDIAGIFGRYIRQIATISPSLLGLLIVAVWAGLFIFLRQSTKRRRLAVLLAWLFPGLGHLYLGMKQRGFIFMATLFATFMVGMVLADFRNISPFERHPIWGMAHFFGGLMAAVPAILTMGWHLESDLPTYGTGCLYSAVASLLNILLMLDVWDRSSRSHDTNGQVLSPPTGIESGGES